MNKKLVIFDLDGTILDTSAGIKSAVKYAIAEFGLDIPSEDILNTFIGPPIQWSLQAFYGLTDERVTLISQVFRDRYKTVDLFKATPYDGLIDVLLEAKRRGILLFVYTNKPHDIALEVLNRCFPKDLFSLLVGIPLGGKVKPDPTPFIDAVSSYHVDFSKACYFGDSTTDIETATNLHCGGIYSVLWGYQSFETLSSFHLKPTAYLENPKEIQLVLDEKL